jgi:hypothetical protein
LTWELIHQIWLERNITKHDSLGCSEVRRKEKLIEIIQGESNCMKHAVYNELEIQKENLVNLPVENLKMIQQNLRSAKADERIRNSNKL